MADPILPRAQSSIADRSGFPSREWYDFFRSLLIFAQANGTVPAEIADILLRLDALEQDGDSFTISGLMSVKVVGSPEAGSVQISLLGDSFTPGPTYYYGTDPDGNKTWGALSDAFEVETGELTKAVDSGGITTFGLADVPDGGGGTLQKTAFDAKGRKTGTSAATTDDLPEGVTNLYFTDERAQDAVGSVLADSADINLTYDDITPAISGVLTTTGIVAGIYGNATNVPQVTLDSKGRATSVVDVPISFPPGVADFIDLGDVPAAYTGSGGYSVKVKATEDGLEFLPGTGSGDVVGPVSSINSNVALFDGITGKLLKDGGTLGTAAFTASTAYATASQGATADTALQPGDNVSTLTNDSGYLTSATGQPLDATLTALAGANWASNAIPIGTGADTLSQTSFAANTFPARASTGNIVAKPITDFGLSLVDDADAAAAKTTLGIPTLDHGTYTPVVTDTINITSYSVNQSQWLRVGNTVNVSGSMSATATLGAVTFTRIRITIPVASNFSSTADLSGAGGVGYTPYSTVLMSAEPTSNVVNFSFYASSTSNVVIFYTFTYRVI